MDSEPDKPYSNREIREHWHDIGNTLQRIELQTTNTNGRVGKLENWRWFITGSITILSIVVVPLLGWALYVLSTIDQKVHSSVDAALSAYNINP